MLITMSHSSTCTVLPQQYEIINATNKTFHNRHVICLHFFCSGEGSRHSDNSEDRTPTAMARAVTVHPDTTKVMYLVLIGTDCIGSCKFNYDTITATTAPYIVDVSCLKIYYLYSAYLKFDAIYSSE
jgi:hypothetical protein